MKGKNGDPVARLTSLGWTCVGQPVTPNFITTFHVRETEDYNYALRKFWEIESKVTYTQSVMTADEKKQ